MPRERLLALALGAGPTGTTLDLRHERRGAPAVLDELGRLLGNLCQAVPQVWAPFLSRRLRRPPCTCMCHRRCSCFNSLKLLLPQPSQHAASCSAFSHLGLLAAAA